MGFTDSKEMLSAAGVDVSAELQHYVIARDQGNCFRCGKALWGHDGYTLVSLADEYSIHHRKPGGVDGKPGQGASLILLCGTGTTGCQGWVESNREDATDAGFFIKSVDNAELLPAYSEYRGKWINLSTGMEVKVYEGDRK